MTDRVAITLGDPRGIGPEIVRKVLETLPAAMQAEFVVLGPDEMVAALATTAAIRAVGVGPAGVDGGDTRPSLTAAEAGLLTGRAIERAARLALDGDVTAIVTAPAEKRALHAAGFEYPGHTEFLSALAGDVDVAMMLTADVLRVVLLTTHMPLRSVSDALSVEGIVRTGKVAQRGLREWLGIAEPRLAMCAVNPHAGEGGLFGDEDDRILAPAAVELGAAGPFPADTVFVRCMRGEFDAVLAPYHDVGMTAIKVAAFGRGVNVTLGLPFVRTSPDHGTAFDIAGRGIADPSSMGEAVRMAIELTRSEERRAKSE